MNKSRFDWRLEVKLQRNVETTNTTISGAQNSQLRNIEPLQKEEDRWIKNSEK